MNRISTNNLIANNIYSAGNYVITGNIIAGTGAQASNSSIAVGHNAKANAPQSCAFSEDAVAGGPWACAIGFNANAGNRSSFGLGEDSSAGGIMSYALGAGATTNSDYSFAFGRGAETINQASFVFCAYDVPSISDTQANQWISYFTGGYYFNGSAVNVGIININQAIYLSPVINSGSILLSNNLLYVNNSTLTSIWTLPLISSTTGLVYQIKNRGNQITLTGTNTDLIFDEFSILSFIVNSGAACRLINDGQYWNII